ncbi:MAG TPA: FAD-dependent oxidoreductase, partial [Chitinophagaceae bacterium]
MKIVIIGNGMVGYKFCEKLIAKTPGQHEITVFGEEIRPAYDRVHLSKFFSGKSASELSLAPASWYVENNITLYLGDPVQHINRAGKTIRSFHGIETSYDVLILATGSSAFVPSIPGVDKEGVFIYRTIEDLEMMSAYAKKAKTGAVIGGGLLGLEAAKAMIDLGITDTQVIEFAPRLMPRQIDDVGSELLKNKLQTLGLKIHTSKNTTAILGDDRIKGMQFSDNTKIDVDMLVISAGIKPRDELAKECGLEVGPRGGIVVNERLQTNDEDIYAIGECALYNGMIYGLVAPGYEMADTVVTNLTSGNKIFAGYDMSTKLKLIGVDVASFGDPFISGNGVKTIAINDNNKGIYKRINIAEDGKTLLGGILVGDAEQYNMLLQTCKNKVVLPPNPEDVIFEVRGGEENGLGVTSLPDDALICSCEAVTKGSICSSVSEINCETVEAIKKCTKAGTGCGGCVPM